MESKEIAKELGITDTTKITETFLSSAPHITSQAIAFMQEKNENRRQAIIEEVVNENITAELRVYSFIATTKHKELQAIGAFENPELLKMEINRHLGSFQALETEEKKKRVSEF